MNGFDEYCDAPHDQLDDDALLNGGPFPATGDDLDLDPADLPF